MKLRCCSCGKIVADGICDMEGKFYPICEKCWNNMRK